MNIFCRQSLCVYLLSLSVLSCTGGGESSEVVKEKQKKQIRKITEKFYKLKDSVLVLTQHIQHTYDDKERIVTDLFLDGSFTMYGTKGYTYTKSGKLKSFIYTEAAYQEKYNAVFDKDDSIAETILEVIVDHIPAKKRVTKFSNGKEVEKSEYDGQGKLNWTDLYEWNANHTELTKKGFDGEKNPVFVSTYTYNEKGEEISYFSLSPRGDTLGKAVHVYDGDNRLKEYVEYKKGAQQKKETREYNSDGKLISIKSTYGKDNVPSQYDFSYNANGDLILEIQKNDLGAVVMKTEFEIEYAK